MPWQNLFFHSNSLDFTSRKRRKELLLILGAVWSMATSPEEHGHPHEQRPEELQRCSGQRDHSPSGQIEGEPTDAVAATPFSEVHDAIDHQPVDAHRQVQTLTLIW
jgi:hypothetical protein